MGVDRLRKFVDNIAGGQRDVENIRLKGRLQKFDWIFARFSRQNAGASVANDAGAKDEEVTCRLCISVDGEAVIKSQSIVVFLEVPDGSAGKGEIIEEPA